MSTDCHRCGGTGECAPSSPALSVPVPCLACMEPGPVPSLHGLSALASLAMRFGEVQRFTRHPDGRTPESDTTHTVMLTLLAMTIAPKEAVFLDVERVLAYCVVHDLVEAYAGDTPTHRGLTALQRLEKQEREHKALERIRVDLMTLGPRIPSLIEDYEAQVNAESRFVKLLDKLTPRLTHLLNGGAALADMTVDELRTRLASSDETRRVAYPEFTLTLSLIEAAGAACVEAWGRR